MPPTSRPRAFVVCLQVLLLVAGARADETVSAEYRLKAAFLSKFPEFVEWPPSALGGRDRFVLCVADGREVARPLRSLVSGTDRRGLPYDVKEIATDQEVGACHLLFIRDGADGRSALMARAATLPVLTIGDAPTFLDEGGIIQLRTVERRIRFEVDLGAAERSGLRLSSQLLRLAVYVRGGRPMKTWFAALPIHRKLVVLALGIAVTALVCATTALVGLDFLRARVLAREETEALARVLAENVAAPLVFDDPDAATTTIRSVRVRSEMRRVCVYGATGRLFAEFARSADLGLPWCARTRACRRPSWAASCRW